ncbi:MAG TPA: NAD(P)-dependent oxidoreductase [Acidimicrobiales bacterium]|nr:NAD(P)-dependent oxidoreductase [Acidimicrobiales bacterium]
MELRPRAWSELLIDDSDAGHEPVAGGVEGRHPPIRRVFITGATGFLGRRMAARLVARSVEVHASRHHSLAPDLGGVTWHTLDLGKEESIREVIETVGADALIHLAWKLDAGYETSSENQAWVGRSLALASAFVESGGRSILMAGSCAEYDWSTVPLSEESPCRPSSPYGAAKLALYREVQSLNDDVVTVVWPRLFFLFGEGERPERVIPRIIRDVAAGRSIDWIDADLRRDYLHADEATDAMVHLLCARVVGAVNVASGSAPTVREIARIVASALEKQEPAMRPPAPSSSSPLEIRADVGKLHRLGWVPSRTVDQALVRLSRAATSDQ